MNELYEGDSDSKGGINRLPNTESPDLVKQSLAYR